MADPRPRPAPGPRRARRPRAPARPAGPARLLRAPLAAALGAALAILAAGCAGQALRPGAPAAAAEVDLTARAGADARDADLGMAAAVATRDLEAFLGHVAPDGIFFGARRPAAGRAAVGVAWGPLFAAEGPRLEWAPDRAVASPSGDLVFTFGHASWRPAGGGAPEAGRYLTVWRRGDDGLLRVALDGSDRPRPPLPAGLAPRALRTFESADGALLAEAGLLMDGAREAGWYLRLSRRAAAGYAPIAEAGALWPVAP